MFAYCGNTPVNAFDPSGCYYYVFGVDSSPQLNFTLRQYTGASGGTYGGARYGTQQTIATSFAYIEEKSEVSGGTKVGQFLGGELDAFSISSDEISILSFELSVVSLDLTSNRHTCSLFNLGNAFAYASIKNGFPGVGAMVSVWSPSATYEFRNATVTSTLHCGALGAEASLNPEKFTVGFAYGMGFSFSVS